MHRVQQSQQGLQTRSMHSPALPTRSSKAFLSPVQRTGQRAMRGPAAPQALSPVTIVTTGLVVGAWYLSQQQAVEQERLEASDRRPCPSCGGSGLQPCFCTKWSDGDVGCSSCSRSGWTKCKSCGGGGMAVPIKVSIRKNDVP